VSFPARPVPASVVRLDSLPSTSRSATPDAQIDDGADALFPMHAHVDAPTYLHQMWERRQFAVAMPLEEVRSTHQDTLLGNLWHLVNPLLSVAVYYLVFGVFLHADRGIDNYVFWLMIGVFTFGLTTRSVLAGATSITSNLGLMRATRFPRALLPISAVLGRLITFGFEIAVLCVVAVVTGAGLTSRLLLLPATLALHTCFNLGLAFVAARLNDSYRDIQQLIPFVFRLLMYVSGVMFPVDQYIDDTEAPWLIRRVVSLNPMVQIVDLYRWIFIGTPLDLLRTVELGGVIALTLVFGFRYFRVHELAYGRA
jgi:teichoic acid transport system permease protein